MNLKQMLTLFVVIGLSLSAEAKKNPTPKTIKATHVTATSFARLFAQLGTVGEYTKFMATRVPDEEMKQLSANYAKMGLTPETKLPVMQADKNRLYFSKNDFVTFNEKTIVYKNHTFKPSNKPFNEVVMDVYKTLNKPKGVASLFIESAHASGFMDFLPALIGTGVGCYAGPQFLGTDTVTGCVGGAVGGLVVGKMFSQDGLQGWGGSNAQPAPLPNFDQPALSCRNGRMVLCSQYPQSVNNGVNFQASSGSVTTSVGINGQPQTTMQTSCRYVSPQEVWQMTGYAPQINCTPVVINDVQTNYNQNFNNRYPRPPVGAVRIPDAPVHQ